jgi:M6 family metalloprotease-like protein
LLVAAVLVAAGTTGMSSPFGAAAGGGVCLPAPTVPGVTEGRSGPGTVAPPVGVLRAALLLVHASDTPPDSAPIARGTFDAAAAWFRTVSYGRLDLRVEPTPRWLALPAPSADYTGEANAERYLRDAVAAADPYVDFSAVDVVYIAPASRTPVTSPTSAILNGFGVRADGKEIRLWIPWGAGFATEEGTPGHLLHETGHLLGLPDLYASGAFVTFHRWDVMAARWPAELLAWHRWKLGWLDEGAIVCVTGRATRTVILRPIERPGGRKAIFVKRGRHVLAIEVRARQGYDRTLCETGVLVYAVDQTPFRRRPVQIFPAQFDADPPRNDCGGLWNAPLDRARGEVAVLRASGVRVEVLARLADGAYRVRVTTGR